MSLLGGLSSPARHVHGGLSSPARHVHGGLSSPARHVHGGLSSPARRGFFWTPVQAFAYIPFASTARRGETAMDRYWFLTWTTYGTWLPGDARGFVGRVWSADEGP